MDSVLSMEGRSFEMVLQKSRHSVFFYSIYQGEFKNR